MTGWPAALFDDPDVAAILGWDRQLADMRRIEAAFSRALGAAGVVDPALANAAARAIEAATIDRDALIVAVARDGVPVPDLVRQFRLQAPDAARPAIHTGLTSQDVIDTALVLALRDLFELFALRLAAVEGRLRDAERRLGRWTVTGVTRSQPALKLTFDARLAGWGAPLPDHAARLGQMRSRVLRLQLGGAVGDRAVLGSRAPAVADAMAGALGLTAPGRSWHADRGSLAEATGWMTLIAGHLGKIGQDVATMALMGEVRVAGGGASSSMPHKANPVLAELLVALARDSAAQQGLMAAAAVHGMERDGAAWMTEWRALPRIAEATGRALTVAPVLIGSLEVPSGG